MKMDKTRILPGNILVNKGALKINSSLPEVGLKDVSPNGSWLEQKQIQAALEARKLMIEVERIEKSGVLSHAQWREELMLAEVTQKVGGYWQYLGHNVGKILYLQPEEALFLMEVNCLLLKYNEVKVSLQQAYALLLRSKISSMQYKVYASLSRLGYRVFRHQRQSESELTESDQNTSSSCWSKDNVSSENNDNINRRKSTSTSTEESKIQKVDPSDNNVSKKDDTITQACISDITHKSSENVHQSDCKDINEALLSEEASTSGTSKIPEIKENKFKGSKYIQHKINKLKSRKYKTKQCNILLNDLFKKIPDFTENLVVNITAPDRCYLPGKIYLKNNLYCLNLEEMSTKSTSEEVHTLSTSPSDTIYTVNQNNSNHLRFPSNPHPPPHRGNNWTEYFNFRFSCQPNPFNFCRPQTNLNYFQFNMTYQRPMMLPQVSPRLIMDPFVPSFLLSDFVGGVSSNSNNNLRRKKRTRDHLKQEHYAFIQKLANIVKTSILELKLSDENVAKLNLMIQTYNIRYKTRLRLSDNFTVITDENIIDTIEVDDDDDDDDEETTKRAKTVEKPASFNDKLQKIKQLAYQLKNIETKAEATSRHRRMFSNLLKGFNNCYNVNYYVDDQFNVINKNDFTIVRSSDSEIVETASVPTTRKKFKNPFSILKKLSEKQIDEESHACTSNSSKECSFTYDKTTVQTFKKGWLPDKSNFGRAEVISNDCASELIDIRRQEFLFDFIKIQPDKFKNWFDAKISFLQCLQETSELFHYNEEHKNNRVKSLVKPQEFNNTELVLKKLNIFENKKKSNMDTDLSVDFDVYNRSVHNFKKSNRPVPHFRIVCVRESSTLPSAADVAGLHLKYKDNVTIVFAAVGVSSVSYLQINPTDLPVYMPSNNT